MVFTSKKKADAYDKTLAIADRVFEFIAEKEFPVSDDDLERLALYMSENRTAILSVLRPIKKPR